MYNVGMLIYASIQYDQIHKAINILSIAGQDAFGNFTEVHLIPGSDVWQDIQPYLVAVPCVIAFFTVVLTGVAWKLYDEFAWTIYKHISADLRMKRRFLTFQVRFPKGDTCATTNGIRSTSLFSNSISSSSSGSLSNSWSSSLISPKPNRGLRSPPFPSRSLSYSWLHSGHGEKTSSE